MATPNLSLPEITSGQGNKHITHNTALGYLDSVLTAPVTKTITDTNAATVTTQELQRARTVVLAAGTPAPTGPIGVTLPAIVRGDFFVLNTTAQAAILAVPGQGTGLPEVPAGEIRLLHQDGTVVRLAGGGPGAGGGGAVAVEDEGAEVISAAARLNFTGNGVNVTDAGSGEVTIDIPGSSVEGMVPVYTIPGLAPPRGAWFPTIVGAPAITEESDSLRFDGATASTQVRAAFKPIPAGNFSIVVKLDETSRFEANYNGAGIFVRDAASGRYLMWGVMAVNAKPWTELGEFTSATAFGQPATGSSRQWEGAWPTWFRLDYVAASKTFTAYRSFDGKTWLGGHTSTWLAAPSDLGIGVVSRSTSYTTTARFTYYDDGEHKGQTITIGGVNTSGGGVVAVEDEGAEVVPAAARLNFTGEGVSVSDDGAGGVTVDIPGGTGGGGTASYPPLEGNAGRVLKVNDAEDGVEWADDLVGSGGVAVPRAATAHQYWRILINNTADSNYAGIGELSLKDDAGGTVSGATWTASSTYGGYPASNVENGNTTAYWCSAQGAKVGSWVQASFPAPVTVWSFALSAPGGYPAYAPTDFALQYSDDGAAWTTAKSFTATGWTSGQTRTFTSYATVRVPKLADFTRIDAQTATYTLSDGDNGLVVKTNSNNQSDKPMLLAQALPVAGGPFTATMKLKAALLNRNFNSAGLAIRDSATGRITFLGLVQNGTSVGAGPTQQNWNTITAWNATTSGNTGAWINEVEWLRLRSDGTTLFFEVSPDGEDWIDWYSVGYKSFCANPDQVGLWLHAQAVGKGIFKLLHWQLG